MDEFKLLSFNCRGLGTVEKRRDVVNYLKNLHYDIYLLQDTHLTKRKEPFFNSLWRGKCYHSFGTFNSRGTSILVSFQTNHKVIHLEHCPEGNYSVLVCTIHSNTYTIINIYGPNEDRPSFFQNIKQKLDLPNANVIIGGDFNFVIDLHQDSNYIRQNNPRAKNAFLEIMEEHSLVDSWRELNPGKKAFTWAKRNPHRFGRLDMFIIGEHQLSLVASSTVIAGYRSDHSIITLHLNSRQKKRGSGLWKFNDSLLLDEEFDEMIKKFIVSL